MEKKNIYTYSKTGKILDSVAKTQSNWLQENTEELSYIQNKPILAKVATSGDYNDLENKLTPKTDGGITIDDKNEISLANGIQTPLQSDWNEQDKNKLSYIQNKPILAKVATSGDYNDLENKLTPKTDGGITIDDKNEISVISEYTSAIFHFTIAKDSFTDKKSTITVSGITKDHLGVCDIVASSKDEIIEWQKINGISTADGSVVVECFESPNIDLNVVMKV